MERRASAKAKPRVFGWKECIVGKWAMTLWGRRDGM